MSAMIRAGIRDITTAPLDICQTYPEGLDCKAIADYLGVNTLMAREIYQEIKTHADWREFCGPRNRLWPVPAPKGVPINPQAVLRDRDIEVLRALYILAGLQLEQKNPMDSVPQDGLTVMVQLGGLIPHINYAATLQSLSVQMSRLRKFRAITKLSGDSRNGYLYRLHRPVGASNPRIYCANPNDLSVIPRAATAKKLVRDIASDLLRYLRLCPSGFNQKNLRYLFNIERPLAKAVLEAMSRSSDWKKIGVGQKSVCYWPVERIGRPSIPKPVPLLSIPAARLLVLLNVRAEPCSSPFEDGLGVATLTYDAIQYLCPGFSASEIRRGFLKLVEVGAIKKEYKGRNSGIYRIFRGIEAIDVSLLAYNIDRMPPEYADRMRPFLLTHPLCEAA